MKRDSQAFTLAEVLITLGIIGVVAAMTLPTLIQNHKKKSIVSKLQKSSSIIAQAYAMATAEYGEGFNQPFEPNNPAVAYEIFNKFYAPYVKISKVEKGTIGVFAYLDDGTAWYFQRSAHNPTDIGWENTYLIVCLTHKACQKLDEEPTALRKGLGAERFTFYASGKIPDSSIKKYGREYALNTCKAGTGIEACTALIGSDGWVISDDYPIKL